MPWILVRFPRASCSTFQSYFFICAKRGLGTQLLLEMLSVDMEDGLWVRSAVLLPDALEQRAERAALTGDVLGWLLNVTC